METTRVVVSGAGAAGVAVTRILLAAGITDIAVTDRLGVLASSRGAAQRLQEGRSPRPPPTCTGRTGTLADVMAGADVFIGVSGGTVPEEVVATMAPDAIIFGLANPHPEVHPDVAHRHARDRGDRSLGLPQPDQQRARVPGHLPRRLRRPRHARSPRA